MSKKSRKKYKGKQQGRKKEEISTSEKQTSQKERFSYNIFNYIYPVLLFFIFIFCYQYIFDKKIDLGGDNIGYYTMGKSVVKGKGFVNIQRKTEPAFTSHPPGYPFIIVASMLIAGDDIPNIKITNGILFFLSLLALFFLIKQLAQNDHLAFTISLLVLLNTHMLRYSTIMMSEIPFFLFSILCLFLFIKMDRKLPPLKNKYFFFFLLCLSASFHIRTAGISLVGGIGLYLLIKKEWKYLIHTAVGFILLAIPWMIYSRSKGDGAGFYLKQLLQKNTYRPELGMVDFMDMVNRFFTNLSRYITKEIPNGIFNFIEVDYQAQATMGEWIFGLALIGLMVYGILCLGKYKLLFGSYLAGTFAILLLWPEMWFGVRFILPTLPVILFLVIYGAYSLINRFTQNALKVKVTPLIFLLLSFLFIPEIKALHKKSNQPFPPNWQNYLTLAKWVKKNTPEGTVVSCRKPGIFYIYADRYTTGYASSLDDKVVIEKLKENGVDYVVLDQLGYSSTARYLQPAIQKNRNMFQLVRQVKNPDTYLLKFTPQ